MDARTTKENWIFFDLETPYGSWSCSKNCTNFFPQKMHKVNTRVHKGRSPLVREAIVVARQSLMEVSSIAIAVHGSTGYSSWRGARLESFDCQLFVYD